MYEIYADDEYEDDVYEYGEDEFEDDDDEYDEMELDDGSTEELALELLESDDVEELEQFLGSIIKSAAKTAGRIYRSPVGKSLRRVAVRAARKYLPQLGASAGQRVGRWAGRGLGNLAATGIDRVLSPEMELETAKQLVRAVKVAAKKAAAAAPVAPPKVIAKEAMLRGMRRYPPSYSRRSAARRGYQRSRRSYGSRYGHHPGRASGGRWYRQGRYIIIAGS